MPATKTKTGFKVCCPKCGEKNTARLDLDTLDTFSCSSCDETWTLDEIREMVAEWSRVIAWVEMVDTMPS